MTSFKHRKKPARVPLELKKKRLKVCRSGKKVFKNVIDANIFLAGMQLKCKNERRCGYHKMPVRAYHCNNCGYYHVTSKARWYN